MRQVTSRGRWVWVLSGLITAAALVIPGTRFLDSPRFPSHLQPPGIVVSAHPTPVSAP